MARTDFIIRFTANSIRITEKDGSNVLYDNFDALGNWSIRVVGDSDLSDPDSQVTFTSKSNERSTAIAEWSEVTSVLVGGVEDISNYANWQEFMDNFLTSFVVTTVSVGNLSGLATATNQSDLLTRFGAANGSPATNTLLYYQLAQATVLSEILEELSTGRTEIANQMTTQGSDSSYLSQDGTGKGSFNWVFTLGAGTNGLGTLYGNNDGTNADFDVAIGNTGSQTADAAGVISWDAPWKYVKFVFTTQTGAGSTFDGTTYAV